MSSVPNEDLPGDRPLEQSMRDELYSVLEHAWSWGASETDIVALWRSVESKNAVTALEQPVRDEVHEMLERAHTWGTHEADIIDLWRIVCRDNEAKGEAYEDERRGA